MRMRFGFQVFAVLTKQGTAALQCHFNVLPGLARAVESHSRATRAARSSCAGSRSSSSAMAATAAALGAYWPRWSCAMRSRTLRGGIRKASA